MPVQPERHFDHGAYRGREQFRENYQQVADALVGALDFETVLDVGSGQGFIIDALLRHEVAVFGVEKAGEAWGCMSEDAAKLTACGDFLAAPGLSGYDLVTCIEVAEHILPGDSQLLVARLARASQRWIYFTAAPPFQPGYGHINCRPTFHWLRWFTAHGFYLDHEATAAIMNGLTGMSPCHWLPVNSLVFRMADA